MDILWACVMTLWVACDRNTTQSCLNRPQNLLGHRIEVPEESLRVKLDQGLERYMRDPLWSDQPSLCAQVWGASWAWDLPCWSQGSPSLVWTGHSICLSACLSLGWLYSVCSSPHGVREAPKQLQLLASHRRHSREKRKLFFPHSSSNSSGKSSDWSCSVQIPIPKQTRGRKNADQLLLGHFFTLELKVQGRLWWRMVLRPWCLPDKSTRPLQGGSGSCRQGGFSEHLHLG